MRERHDGVRLFVDDLRSPEQVGLPSEHWTVARTSKAAIAILKSGSVIECSLDHDLGGEDTGYRVVCWMEEHDVWPGEGVHCHSANPVGSTRIRTVITRHAIAKEKQ